MTGTIRLGISRKRPILLALGVLSALLLLPLEPAGTHAAAPTATATPAGCATPLALILRPGLRMPSQGVSLLAAPDIPPGQVAIQVPLYPGAAASALPMPHADFSYPASHYLKSATAEYQLSTGWTAASSWYQHAFTPCGYTEVEHGSKRVSGVTVSIGMTMRDSHHPPISVSLAFTHGPANTTLVLYLAYTITLPAPATMVPGTPNAVTILSYRPLLPGQLAAPTPNEYVVVRDAGSIRALARHLNSLPPPKGVIACPADNGSHDTLRFAYSDGHQVTVDVEVTGCRVAREGNLLGLGLADNDLFLLLDKLLARPSAVHLGLPFDARTLRLAARRAHTRDGRASFLAWNPGGSEYLYLDHGSLWVAGRDNRWRRQIARGPVAQGAFDPSGDFLYRPLVHSTLGPLTVVAQQSRRDHYRYAVRWAPHTPIVGTQAGMGNPWSNGMVLCAMHLWFPQSGRLVGIDPHYRSDTERPALRLPPITSTTRIAVTCDGSLAAIATAAGGLEIRDVQSGKLIRRMRLAAAVIGLSWAPDNRMLAYVIGGVDGVLADVDTRTGRRHILAHLNGDTVEGITWDPYAHTLAFSRLARSGLVGELEMVNADGSGLRALEGPGGTLPALPQWSSRGGGIGYTRETLEGGERQLTDVWVDCLTVPHPYPGVAGSGR